MQTKQCDDRRMKQAVVDRKDRTQAREIVKTRNRQGKIGKLEAGRRNKKDRKQAVK